MNSIDQHQDHTGWKNGQKVLDVIIGGVLDPLINFFYRSEWCGYGFEQLKGSFQKVYLQVKAYSSIRGKANS